MNKISKVALVTGSSSGIGAGIVKTLAANGYVVVITYLNHKNWATQLKGEITNFGGRAEVMKLDVTEEKSVKECFAFVQKKFRGLDVLVNNAAVDGVAPIETCSFEKWRAITRTKTDGNFLCTKYALPLLKKSGKADLIIIVSNLGDRPDTDDVPYSVATAGAVCFIKAMAKSLAKYGIRTNGVSPAETRTNNGYWQEAGLTTDEVWEKFAQANPLGRVCTPEDVGETVLAIVENKTSYWNGNVIYVNGGGHL
ncbi:MAG TPA: SDR family oxidoreductase [Candidatus Woesebacteria bacterium]|nr:SDR family oxidoreductase [Candidatus Woesebacteria bacterium]